MFGALDTAGPIEMMIIMPILYIVPTVIGLVKKKSNLLVIALVNLLLGWTVIGWIAALVMALKKETMKNG